MSVSSWQDTAIQAIDDSLDRLRELRTFEESRRREWYGLTLKMTIPGVSTFEIYTEWLEHYLEIGFRAHGFDGVQRSDPPPTFSFGQTSPPAFNLWQVVRARGIQTKDYSGGLESWDYDVVRAYMDRAVGEVISTCLPIIDGDFSIAAKIRR